MCDAHNPVAATSQLRLLLIRFKKDGLMEPIRIQPACIGEAGCSLPGKFDELSTRVTNLEACLTENTRLTKTIATHTESIVEIVTTYAQVKTTGSTLKKGITWLTPVAVGLSAIGGALVALWHFVLGTK
jgi:hypothetical protein